MFNFDISRKLAKERYNNKKTEIYKSIHLSDQIQCFDLPSNVYFEDNETFINSHGFFKRISKLIPLKNNSKTNWQIIRKLFIYSYRTASQITNKKNNNILVYDCGNFFDFRNFINFIYYSTHSLTSLNFLLTTNNKPFYNLTINLFKVASIKLWNTKLKFWLDDFFTGGKDGYSPNSLILNICSKNIRENSSNFF